MRLVMNDWVDTIPRLSATCLNIMAKFVNLARQKEHIDLHLQDKQILSKIEQIASSTNNPQLRLLYDRLIQEMDKQVNTVNVDLDEQVDTKPKAHWIGSMLKDLSRSFR